VANLFFSNEGQASKQRPVAFLRRDIITTGTMQQETIKLNMHMHI
jgi:hypothetical protein